MSCEYITVCDFYDNLDNEYRIFSNYSLYPVNIDGEEWPTSEHYYHSKKFSSEENDNDDGDTNWYRNIIKNSTANKSKQLGNQKSGRYGETIINSKNDRHSICDIIDESKSRFIHIRNDWNIFKDRVMYYAVKEKINQHPKIKDILLNTGNSIIREANPCNFYWGMGKNNTGKNMLGNIFMKIRDELRGINHEMDYYEEMTDKSRHIKLSTKKEKIKETDIEQAYDLLFDSEDKPDDDKLKIKEKAMYMLQKENLENYNILKLRYLIKIYSNEKYIFTAKRKIQLINDLGNMILSDENKNE